MLGNHRRALAMSQAIPFYAAQYDVHEHGGAVGDVEIGLDIPTDVVVTHGLIRILEAPTSTGAATVAVRVEVADDMLAPTAIAAMTGLLDIVPNGTAANAIAVTQPRKITVTIGTEALTTGRFLIGFYYLPMGA